MSHGLFNERSLGLLGRAVFANRGKFLANLCLANYLLVLLASECFHQHGPHGHHGSPAAHVHLCCGGHGVAQADEAVDVSLHAVVGQSGVEHTGDCLTCRFWGQKTIPPQTEWTEYSTLCAPLVALCAARYDATPLAQLPIRGPPAIA